MAWGSSILYMFALCMLGQALTPSSFLTTIDKARLRAVFEASHPYTDVASAHYSILGLKLLGVPIPKQQDLCKTVTANVNTANVESLFHAAAASKALDNCKLSTDASIKQLLADAFQEGATVAALFHAFFASKSLGLPVDDKKVSQSLLDALKKDDSPISHGYAFHIAAELTGDVTKFFDNIEDVIAQADEVDDKYLQFEGGLYITSFVIDGAYKLSEKSKKAPTISEDKVVKFANYFLSRKHVHQLRAAYNFLSAVTTLTNNKYHIPIAVSLASPVAVTQKDQLVQVRVTDLLGGSLGALSVTADSARHRGDDSVVISKKPFTVSQADSSLYELKFLDVRPARGFYKVTINVNPAKKDARLIGTSGAEVSVKVTTRVSIENVEIGVGDKDQTTATKTTKIEHPNKAKTVLEADYHQKLVLKFQLRDKSTSDLMTVHQAFVRLTSQQTKQEIIFVTEADGALTNSFDLDVGASAKDFDNLSGKYTVEVIIGDTAIENPFSWLVADVQLTFSENIEEPKVKEDQYGKKQEIKHLFREDEKRPPKAVSTTFSILVLVPLVIMLLLWMRVGVNVSNFKFSLSAVGFHVCLAGVFGLYYCYWVQLDMFTTTRWLGLISIPLFLFGNRLLSGIAARRK